MKFVGKRISRLSCLILAIIITIGFVIPAKADIPVIDYNSLSLEELQTIIDNAEIAIEENHSVSGSVESALKSKLKVSVMQLVPDLDSEPSWPWFNWEYQREWDMLTIITEADFGDGYVPVKGIYHENQDKLDLVYLEIDQNVLFNEQESSSNETAKGERPETDESAKAKKKDIIAKKGDVNETVELIQEALIHLGYFKGKVDGQYGRKLKDAVKKFQADSSLEQTGTVDSATYDMLYNVYLSLPNNTEESSEPIIEATSVVASEGDVNKTVESIQETLYYLGYYTGSIDSSYGSDLTDAVKQFQGDSSLPITGIVDDATYAMIRQVYRSMPTKEPTPEPTLAPTPESVIQVNAKALNDEYNENEVSADLKYKNKTLAVYGNVDSVDKGFFGGITVRLQVDEYGFLTVDCSMNKDQANIVASLYTGQAVVIQGTCTGIILGSVQLSDCLIIG